MGSETIKIYIPKIECPDFDTKDTIQQFKKTLCNIMDSVTTTECTKIYKDKYGDIIEYKAECITVHGNISLSKESVTSEAIQLAIKLGLNDLDMEINDTVKHVDNIELNRFLNEQKQKYTH